MIRVEFSVATVAVLVLTLSACAPTADEAAGKLAPSLAVLIDQALEQDDLSEWDRATLEKASKEGQVSQADYIEGMDLYDACLKSAGVEFTQKTLLNGVIEMQPLPGQATEAELDAQAKAQYDCSVNVVTQEIFRMQQANPDLLADFPQAAVNCLKTAEVVDDDFSRDDLEKALELQGESGRLPFDLMDPKAQTCLYSLGYVVVIEE